MRRICVVGAGGQIGGVHLESLLQLKEAGYLKEWGISICSSSPAVRGGDLSNSANNLNVNVRKSFDPQVDDILVFDELDDVIDSFEVAAVIIASPTVYHVDQCIQSMAACKSVLVEKPLGLDVPSVAQVLQTIEEQVSEECPPYVAVGQILPYFDPYRALIQSIGWAKQGGERTLSASFRRTLFGEHPFANPAKATEIGSPWLDLAVHDIHLMMTLFGEPNGFSIVPSSVRTSPDDRSYLLRCKARFEYPQATFSVEAGIDSLQSDPFGHSFCVEQEDGEAFVMSSTETSWQARCRTTQQPLLIPQSLKGVSADIMPFALEQLDFMNGIQVGKVSKYLCPYTAAHAVQQAVMVQEAAVASVCV
jgi:predicted dehydrogenase